MCSISFFSQLIILDKPRSKTPTPFGSTPLVDTLPLRSRTPLPTTTRVTHSTTTEQNNPYDNNLSFLQSNTVETSTPIIETDLSPNSMNNFDRQTAWSRSARDIRTTTNGNSSMLRSKTPGPEFGTSISSSYRANTLLASRQRSKTPTANDFSTNQLQNRFVVSQLIVCLIEDSLLVDHYNRFILNILN